MTQSHKDAAVEFLELVAAGNVREAYRKHVGPEFRHHNPYFAGDAAALMRGMEENAARNPGKVLAVQMALQDGARAMVFSHVKQGPDDRGAAVVHVFRFENDRIVELWDVAQPVPERSVNGNGMF